MKKKTAFLLILTLLLTISSCKSGQQDSKDEAPIVNPIDLSIEISAPSEAIKDSGFENIGPADFSAEEGATVLEATQLYCMANDISITLNEEENHIIELNGLRTEDEEGEGQGDWSFKVNGESLSLKASDTVLEEHDSIRWEYASSDSDKEEP